MFEISKQAYVKIGLHTFKYPYDSVNGLLICDKREEPTDSIVVNDIIPMFHQCIYLTPMLEIALTQIDIYCEQNEKSICGYYQANSLLVHNEPDMFAIKIMDKIISNSENSCLAMVNNMKLTMGEGESFLDIYQLSEGKWKLRNNNEEDKNGSQHILTLIQILKTNGQNLLMDFDNHFDNITNDWRNFEINSIITNA